MRMLLAAAALLLLTGTPVVVLPAAAASFDCAAASTAFEHAICDFPELSEADDRLAKTYATAIGGLSDPALEQLRQDQRAWLDYAQRACTPTAEPMRSGRYEQDDLYCLTDVFDSRSRDLEQSRMIGGIRFYPVSFFRALPDPYEAENLNSNWPVATHTLSLIQIDGDDALAQSFNQLVRQEGGADAFAEWSGAENESSDTSDSFFIEGLPGTNRITLVANTFWYGHGAAHGNYTITYRHYLAQEDRWLEASDMFTGKGWQKALLNMVVRAAEAEHGEALMLDDTQYIADSVADPTRWDLSSPYDLIIQFQPYEISGYAYGAPTVRISWQDLEPYLTENARRIRDGY
jgi:uncharacterized protein